MSVGMVCSGMTLELVEEESRKALLTHYGLLQVLCQEHLMNEECLKHTTLPIFNHNTAKIAFLY